MSSELTVAAILLLAVACGASAAELTVADGGKSEFRIVTAPQPAGHLQLAATELQSFLKQISDAELPLADDTGAPGAHEIILGDNAHLRAVLPAADLAALKPDGFVIRTVGPHLVIAGGDDRGTLYGVYSFLEDTLGCRWWTPEASLVPRRPRLAVPELSRRDRPALAFREVYYQGAMEPRFALRHKLNGNASVIADGKTKREIHPGWGFWCHSFFTLVPPDKYFADHPEYFSEVNGKRVRDGQLCLTNPQVLEIVTEDLRRRMAAAPELTTWSVSQNDCAGNCQCANCRAIDEREGTPMGSLLEFINKLAARFPDKTISTLSYQYTRRPPKTLKPAPNVLIMLCSIECNRSRPIATDPSSADFRDDVQKWASICDKVFVWDYVVQFANLVSPFPNFQVLQPDVQFFVKNHAQGLFSQGNRERGGEFCELRAYLLAKLHWNPDCDLQRAKAEFLDGYYGAAGAPLGRYLDLQQQALQDSGADLRIFGGPAAARNSYLTPELVARYEALLDEAERAVAEQPQLLLRVRKERMSLQYAILELQYGDIAHRQQVAERLLAAAEATGLLMFNEWSLPTERYQAQVAEGFRRERLRELRLPLRSGRLTVELAPGLAGGLSALRLDGGDNLLYFGQPDDWDTHSSGGYYELFGEGTRGVGVEAFDPTVTDTPEGKQVSLKPLGAKLPFTRTLTVPAQGERFELRSTVTPPADNPPARGLWSRLCLDLGPTDQLTAIAPAMGERGVLSLSLPADETQRDLWFAPAQLASGLTLANHARSVAVRLTPAVDLCEAAWLHVDARRRMVVFGAKSARGEGERGLALGVQVLSDLQGIPGSSGQPVAHRAGTLRCAANRLFIENYGKEAWLEEDPTASGGWAARLAPDHRMWCLAWFYDPGQFEPDTKYDVFARVRIQKKGEAGQALWAGVYDEPSRRGLAENHPAVADLPGNEWVTVKLGTIAPGPHQYAWCGPLNNTDNVTALWFDYFEFRAVGK